MEVMSHRMVQETTLTDPGKIVSDLFSKDYRNSAEGATQSRKKKV